MIRSLCFSSLLLALFSINLARNASACDENNYPPSYQPPMTLAGLGQTCSYYPGYGPQCAPGLVCANPGFNVGFGVCVVPNNGGNWGNWHGGWGHWGGGWHRGGHGGWGGGHH